MNAKFIIEQIVMSMSFLKADQFTEHTFVKQEDEHGMYKFLKTVINHPETGYLQNGIKSIAIKFDHIKKNWEERSWSMVLDILAELNKVEDIEELREVLLNLHFYLVEKNKLPHVDIFLTKPKWEPQIEVYNYLVSDHFNSGCLTEDKFDNWIELALSTYCRQYQLIFDYIKLPEICSEHVFQIANSEERRDYIIKSLRGFLFDSKETDVTEKEPVINDQNPKDPFVSAEMGILKTALSTGKITQKDFDTLSQMTPQQMLDQLVITINQNTRQSIKGDLISDVTQPVQEILNKSTKDKEMKQDQFYTKLYFYSDLKRVIKSQSPIEEISDCFNCLSQHEKVAVCNEFGITTCSPKLVPGIATVFATMVMNMDQTVLVRKLTDMISHGLILDIHTRIEQCQTLRDINNLHQFVMATFNGMTTPDLKDIIVKYVSIDPVSKFVHNGEQLASFFAGVVYADAMTLYNRKKECSTNAQMNTFDSNGSIYPKLDKLISDMVPQGFVPDFHNQAYILQTFGGINKNPESKPIEEVLAQSAILNECLSKTRLDARHQDENGVMNRQLDKVMGDQYVQDTPRVVVVSYL